jgi:hypothetical protein
MLNKSALTVLLLALLPPLPALAQGPIARTGIVAATGANPNGALNDIAYNDKQRVYLQVWGHPAVYGRFVNEHGTALFGGPFVIGAQSNSDAMPRVAYSAGSNDDVFLVRFTSELSGGQHLYVRTVRYTPNGPVMGPPQHVFGSGSGVARAGGLAFNPFKRQFLLTWETPSSGWEVFGQLWQMSGDAANPSIAAATAVLNISEMNNAQGTPNVAYDWKHDNYLVVFRGEHPGSEFVKGSWARRVSFDANNTMTKSGVIELSSGFGEPAEQNVVYMPEADRYLTFWTDVTSARDLTGRIVDHSGALVSGIFPILATGGNEGAADAKYSPYTRSIFVAAMREATKYIQGIRLTAHGAIANPATDFFQASSVIPSGNESFYPHVTVGHDGRFGLGYVNNYMDVYTELLQGTLIAGGDFIGDPPPPPPPACTIGFSASSVSFGALGGGSSFTLTTGGSCTWTVGANAPWIILGASSLSGTGSNTIAYTVTSNASGTARTGIIYSGNRSVTVTQAGGSWKLKDFSGDGRNDLIWQNRSTGELSIWRMNGVNIISGDYLSPANIGDTNWKIRGTLDANLDGQTDLLLQHDAGSVAIWRMNKETRVETVMLSQSVVSEPKWQIVGTADMDRDGFSDILWQHPDGRVAVWYLFGTGYQVRQSAIVATVSDPGWRVGGIEDFNHDGRPDILWRHTGSGQLFVWHMDDRKFLSSGMNLIVANNQWQIAAVGDFSGDGKPDLVWQNTTTGELAAWFLSSGTFLNSWSLNPGRIADTNWRIAGPR